MKKLFIVLFVFIVNVSIAQQAEKTLIKTLNANNTEQLVLDLAGNVTVEKWNNPTIRVQMQISYQNANVHIMKYLITKGRYNLKSEMTADGLKITTPAATEDVVISKDGKTLEETIFYTIYVPEKVNVLINNGDEAVFSAASNKPANK